MSALNGTWQKKGWTNILELIPLCEKVKKLSAICKICSTNANYTFRTCSGNSTEMIGGAEMYMPLCRECFNEKTKQQNLAMQILHSESQSTTFNESSEDATEQLLDMEQLRLDNSANNSEVKNCSPANLRNTSPLSIDEAPHKDKKNLPTK